MTGIYKITNTTNGKCYIGKAKDIELRWKQHLKDLRNNEHDNEHLQSSFNICGESAFVFEVVIECDESMLNYYERELIEEFEARDNRFGYNMRTGGDGGFANPEVNEKISNTISNLWQNEEYRNHMSEVHKGQEYHGGGTKKGTHKGFESSSGIPVMILETGEIFGSKALCGERIGCSAQAINKAIKNNKKCKGFTIVLYNV